MSIKERLRERSRNIRAMDELSASDCDLLADIAAAADEIARLEAEVERLADTYGRLREVHALDRSARETLTAERDALRAALEPFAAVWEDYGRHNPALMEFIAEGDLLEVEALDLRRAHAALAQRPKSEPQAPAPDSPHDATWPHAVDCKGCRRDELCNRCGNGLYGRRCDNGRCGGCHLAVCPAPAPPEPAEVCGTCGGEGHVIVRMEAVAAPPAPLMMIKVSDPCPACAGGEG